MLAACQFSPNTPIAQRGLAMRNIISRGTAISGTKSTARAARTPVPIEECLLVHIEIQYVGTQAGSATCNDLELRELTEQINNPEHHGKGKDQSDSGDVVAKRWQILTLRLSSPR